jgi:hypothetical protein
VRSFILLSVIVASNVIASRARADEPERHQLAVTLSSGTLLPEDHVYRLGLVGWSIPPTLYAGLSLEGDLAPRIRLEGSLGIEASLGFVLGTSLRYVALERSGFSVALGAGPLVTTGAEFGTGVFGGGGVAARYVVPRTPFVVAVDVGLAFALNNAGTMSCGVDTCTAYIRRGDRLENVVASLGWAFDL